MDVEQRLDDDKNNLPEQDIGESEKLQSLDRSFSPMIYSKDRGRPDDSLRHMYGMDKGFRDEGNGICIYVYIYKSCVRVWMRVFVCPCVCGCA